MSSWVPGPSGQKVGGNSLFSCFFDLVFYRYFFDFGSLFDSIFREISCFLHHFFEYEICIDFASILERILISFSMVVWWISHSRIHLARSLAKLVFEQQYGVLRSKSRFYPFRKHNFSWFSWSFSIPVLALTFYAPRLPADPLARSECIRSFVFSLRALQAPCLGTTLGGTPPPEPHPQGPPTHPQDPHPPTPPHPPLVRVEGYSKWMVIPDVFFPKWLKNWCLFRVHGYSEGSYFNLKFESNKQGRAHWVIRCRRHWLLRWDHCNVSVQSQRGAACKDHQEHPGAPQEHQAHTRTAKEHPRSIQELPRSIQKHPRSTQKRPGALEPVQAKWLTHSTRTRLSQESTQSTE